MKKIIIIIFFSLLLLLSGCKKDIKKIDNEKINKTEKTIGKKQANINLIILVALLEK